MRETSEGAYVKFSDVEHLVEALKFYADESNWSYQCGNYCCNTSELHTIQDTDDIERLYKDDTTVAGKKARQALSKVGMEDKNEQI